MLYTEDQLLRAIRLAKAYWIDQAEMPYTPGNYYGRVEFEYSEADILHQMVTENATKSNDIAAESTALHKAVTKNSVPELNVASKARETNITEYPYVEFDIRGFVTYRESEPGKWIAFEYDSEGRQTKSVDSTGFTVFNEYESPYTNKPTSYTEIDMGKAVFWAKWKYDESGKEIYYENSDGKRYTNGIKIS